MQSCKNRTANIVLINPITRIKNNHSVAVPGHSFRTFVTFVTNKGKECIKHVIGSQKMENMTAHLNRLVFRSKGEDWATLELVVALFPCSMFELGWEYLSSSVTWM